MRYAVLGTTPSSGALIDEVRPLVLNGFRPVVFCRYIATAHYVGHELKQALSAGNTHIEVVTGELTSDQREERVDALAELDEKIAPILVATDCLSEGVNLQNHFNAVVHYDPHLESDAPRTARGAGRTVSAKPPTPFARSCSTARTIPSTVPSLRVILRKAEKIRKELGVAVPLPADNNKVIDAIMKAVLLHRGRHSRADQMAFEFVKTETEVDDAWRTVSNRMTRTFFAQRRFTPNDILPEWRKAVSVLGGPDDVDRFVRLSAERLGAALDGRDGYCRMPVIHFPKPLQDRLDAIGFTASAKIAFAQPAPAGADYIHRAHPLVAVLADYVAERALDAGDAEIGARAGAIFTRAVETRTVLYLPAPSLPTRNRAARPGRPVLAAQVTSRRGMPRRRSSEAAPAPK